MEPPDDPFSNVFKDVEWYKMELRECRDLWGKIWPYIETGNPELEETILKMDKLLGKDGG